MEYKKLLDNGNSIEDIQVLTAKNVGDCGAIVLNNMIQRVANPNYGSEVNMKIGDTTYYKGQCGVSDWTDIVAVSAGHYHTVGLKSDGTVVAVGYNSYGQCDVSDLTDIVAIGTGYDYTIGLKSDGTVVAIGKDQKCQCDVSDWVDIKLPVRD